MTIKETGAWTRRRPQEISTDVTEYESGSLSSSASPNININLGMARSSVPTSGVWMLALLVLGSLLGALGEPQAGGDWNALSGMWGKRASSDWNRLSSMWGKRGPYGPYQALLLRAGESGEGAGHGISARAAGPAVLRENHWNDLSGYWG